MALSSQKDFIDTLLAAASSGSFYIMGLYSTLEYQCRHSLKPNHPWPGHRREASPVFKGACLFPAICQKQMSLA